MFRNPLAETIYKQKYSHGGSYTWQRLSDVLIDDITGTRGGKLDPLLSKEERAALADHHRKMKFIAGGRYLYYAGRPLLAISNCYLFSGQEDTREEWGSLLQRTSDSLMTGGGVGVDYSIFRPKGAKLARTGGLASGPIPLMHSVNEVGRNVMQGGSRRSAIYASLNWKHEDAPDFLKAKNWDEMPIGKAKKLDGTPYTYKDAKEDNFNFPAPLDMTNISLNYDDAWLNLPDRHLHPTFLENTRQALRTAEPGWSFNFGEKQDETLRNACTEVTSEDDSDVCNLASANMSQIDTIEEFAEVVYLASKFLYCGTIRGDVPFEKVRKIRDQNRRLGLGLMGIHEWLLKRGYPYEVVPELHQWLEVYRRESERGANEVADAFGLPRPKAYRAIAPTGSIGLIAKKLAA